MKRCIENQTSDLILDQNILPQSKDEPPNKRRRLQRKKPESPPWKNALADGPSSFTQEGKRRSGRVNSIPLELQPSSENPPRRSTHRSCLAKSKRDVKENKGKNSTLEVPRAGPTLRIKKSRSSTPAHSPKTTSISVLPKDSNRKSLPNDCKKKPSGALIGSLNSSEIPRPAQTPNLEVLKQSTGNKAKIRLRVKPPTLPLVHPGLVLSRPRQYPSLLDYLHNAEGQHVNKGGLFHPEDPSDYPADGAQHDALLIIQAEEASKSGGILSPGRCRVYNELEESHQVPRQYSHLDHMCRAIIGFKKLMQIEQKNHRQAAKRLAEACKDEWHRRQPKTPEQLEAELTVTSQLRYKGIVKTLQVTWDNVKSEVNRRRLIEWEIKEQARVKKALSEAVDKSQQKLEERKAYLGSDILSEEYENEIDEGTDVIDEMRSYLDSDDRESNMSIEESEAEEDETLMDSVEDERLTVEQLHEKYDVLKSPPNKLPCEDITDARETSNLAKVSQDIIIEINSASDDSDKSIDMDDHPSSGDDDKESNSDDEEDEDTNDNSYLGVITSSEPEAKRFSKSGPVVEPINDIVEFQERDGVYMFSEKRNSHAQSIVSANHLEEGSKLNGVCHENDALGPPSKKFISSLAMQNPTPILIGPKQSETTSPTDSFSPLPGDIQPNHSNSENASSTIPQHKPIKTLVPFLLRGTLREYQHYGLDWLAGLYANNTNGILADEMGLGKTIQTISLLAHLACVHEEWGPHLVIVPTSVMLNWEMEFKKWCPGFKIMTYYGTIDERKKKRAGWKNKDAWNVCITSYQIIIRDQQVFKRRRWHYMILDEAHNIKNFNSQRWQTMLTFNTRARLLLTGTPLQNNLTELWSLLYFLMPSDSTNQGVGGFADLQEFQDWFKKPSEQILEHGREQMDNESRGIISKLHKILRPYLLRRLKADVEKQMPAKYEHVEYCRLSKRQRELYDGFLSREDTRGTLASGNYLSIINCLMQLRKVCNHPDLFIDRPISTSFPMEKSVIADFEIKEFFIRRRLLEDDSMSKASLEFLNLVPTKHERLSDSTASRIFSLSAQQTLIEMREIQCLRAQNAYASFDPSTVKSNLAYLESASRWGRFEELQHCVYLNALQRQQTPIYGSQLIELLTLGLSEPLPRPQRRDKLMDWLKNNSPVMKDLIRPLSFYAENLKSMIQKFICLTPAVIAKDITYFTLTPRGVTAIQNHVDVSRPDPFHEARMRLSIQFPDKRLLQYDCGKLQTLDKLLRRLQIGGHRALIFTQMTKVLDILEQFLNIHGHKYLRLDGSTKVEQRQILTDRFNNDTRILAFILSSRSGGLGINLTGADTVIFYDLDWNPAMDKQCQDRCHRIGQTRDVHIYRLISEHTIEANILRKANQKRMLDDVVIQEGEFTTDYFHREPAPDVVIDDLRLLDGDAAAHAAMERVLGRPDNHAVRQVLSQAEDREDVIAARLAEREIVQIDAADFDENSGGTAEVTGDTLIMEDVISIDAKLAGGVEENEVSASGERLHSIDDYMLSFMEEELKDVSVELPKDKIKSKKAKYYRSHRIRL